MTIYNPEIARDTAIQTFKRKAYEIRPNNPFIYISRIISPDYVDIRLLAGGPEERSVIIQYLTKATKFLNPDVIGSFVTADVPFASMVADRLSLPLFYMREDEKVHGRERSIEGMREEEIAGKEVLHVGDLLTRGTTAVTLANGVRNVGGKLSYHLPIFDRLQGGSQTLGSLYPSVSVVSLCEMDENFYQVGIDSGAVVQQDVDEVLRYRRDQKQWAIDFLTRNQDWLKNKIAGSVRDGTLTNRDSLEIITKGYPDVPEIQELGKVVPAWLEELGVKGAVPEFGYKVYLKSLK